MTWGRFRAECLHQELFRFRTIYFSSAQGRVLRIRRQKLRYLPLWKKATCRVHRSKIRPRSREVDTPRRSPIRFRNSKVLQDALLRSSLHGNLTQRDRGLTPNSGKSTDSQSSEPIRSLRQKYRPRVRTSNQQLRNLFRGSVSHLECPYLRIKWPLISDSWLGNVKSETSFYPRAVRDMTAIIHLVYEALTRGCIPL